MTGGTGFVGSALVHALAAAGYEVTVLARRKSTLPDVRSQLIADLTQLPCSTAEILHGHHALVHLAARVHVMREASEKVAWQEFQRINVKATGQLARLAAAAGVRRFVFVSSIKVNGEMTGPGRFFSADDAPAPVDAYGESKREAESVLRQVAAETGMEVVIIRPPLVYGPGVKANFQAMINWLNKGVPLPLGAIHNKRSLVALGNLVDLIMVCLRHPAAANQTFLVSDGEDVSTTELLRRMSLALGKSPRLLPVPMVVLERVARVLGREAVAQRLCGSLQLDIAKTRDLLGWSPPIAMEEGLRQTADAFNEASALECP